MGNASAQNKDRGPHRLTFAEILEAKDITEQEVPIEEWGGVVVVKSISKRTQDTIRARLKDEANGEDIDPEDVEREIFIEGMIEPKIGREEYELLKDKNANAVNKVFTAINGVSANDPKAVKKAEKRFPE